MKITSSLAALGLSTALIATGANAKDFLVKAITAGPVSGSALSVVKLQANKKPGARIAYFMDSEEEAEEGDDLGTATSRYTAGRIGKWLTVNKTRRFTKSRTTIEDDEETIGEGEETETVSNPRPPITQPVEDDEETAVNEETEADDEDAIVDEETPDTETGIDEGGETDSTDNTDTTDNTDNTDTTGNTDTTDNTGNSGNTGTTDTSTPISPNATVWANFDALMQSGQVTGGDRIFLQAGYHGQINITGKKFSSPVLIAPATGATAHADAIVVVNSSNIQVKGLKVWARTANASNIAAVRSYADVTNVAFTDLDIRSVADSPNYASWSQSQWLANMRWGMMLDGTKVTAARNRITGVSHAINSSGPNALIEDNIIDGIGGDGMRALGDNTMVRGNKIQNCFQVDGNHADGIQSFSRGANGTPGAGTVHNLTIENNKIFEWTLSSTNPLRCSLQGIGMFDGMYDGVTIQNNVIQSTAYHGITITGALNSVVSNNTVLNTKASGDNWPWIMISAHKNGTPSKNTQVANNLTMGLNVPTDTANKVTATNNLVTKNATAEVVGFASKNFALASTSKAVDGGVASLAPADDIAGTKRPKGKAPDIGAYESY